MNRWVILGAAAALALAPLAARADSAKDFFGPTKMHTVHIEVSAKDWDALPPKGGGFFGAPPGGGPGGRPMGPGAPGAPGGGAGGAGKFGFEFHYGHATVTIDDKSVKDVGLRF